MFVPLPNISWSSANIIFSLSNISPTFRLYATSRSFNSSIASVNIGNPNGDEISTLLACGVRSMPNMGPSILSLLALSIGGVSGSKSDHLVLFNAIGSPTLFAE